MQVDLIFSFVVASILLTVMPGPDNIFVLTESITKGRRTGIAISVGLVLGVLMHTIAAATGLSILLQESPIMFNVIKYLGASYLFYLSYLTIKEKEVKTELSMEGKEPLENDWKLVRKGFFMNILNPKVSLFFIAFLPQFITPSGFHIALQMIVLGGIFMGQALLVVSLVAIFSGTFSRYLNNTSFWKISKWAKVIVLIVLGCLIAFSEKN